MRTFVYIWKYFLTLRSVDFAPDDGPTQPTLAPGYRGRVGKFLNT